jgi:hypothetical protein
LGAIGLLQRYEAGGRDSAAVRAPTRRTTQVAAQAHVSRAHAGDGLTYDVCFDRMELELRLEVIRAGKEKGGKLKLEVKKVVAGSMAGDGEVHVRDELVGVQGSRWRLAQGWVRTANGKIHAGCHSAAMPTRAAVPARWAATRTRRPDHWHAFGEISLADTEQRARESCSSWVPQQAIRRRGG